MSYLATSDPEKGFTALSGSMQPFNGILPGKTISGPMRRSCRDLSTQGTDCAPAVLGREQTASWGPYGRAALTGEDAGRENCANRGSLESRPTFGTGDSFESLKCSKA